MSKRAFLPGVSLDPRRSAGHFAAMTDLSDDLIQPFLIDLTGLRGRLVRIGAVADEILTRHAYPEAVAQVLGELLALAATLAAALKYEGVFTVQTKGDGPIKVMVADVTSAGQMRGYAQFDPERLESALAGPIEAPVPRLLGSGYLAFTVDQGADTDRYQGIVELDGSTLAECAHHYFRQSEQIEAGIRLAARRTADGTWRAGALMLQRVPDEGGVFEKTAKQREAEDDDWRRSMLLMGSSRDTELTDPDLHPHGLLFRLFHEDGVRVFSPQPLRAECRCSDQRVVSVLAALPRADLEDLREDGLVVVTCEFCNRSYRYDDQDLDRIYS